MPEHTFTFPSRRRISGAHLGESQSARRGRSTDVASSRSYQPGDDPRAIDWRGSARISAARGRDEFLVREFFSEETPIAAILVDRSPSMTMPVPAPFLRKSEAAAVCARLIADSALHQRSTFAYLEQHDEGAFLWAPPGARSGRQLLDEWTASPRTSGSCPLNLMVELARYRRHLPAGALVFVLSDFLDQIEEDVWALVAGCEWELVPVVIQDPVWEQSFPLEAAGLVLPLAGGEAARITKQDAARLKAAHEQRLMDLTASISMHGFHPVVIGTTDGGVAAAAFQRWADLIVPRRRRAA